MALTISPKVTFNGREALRALIDEKFMRPALSRMMQTLSGVKAKEQIAFMERIYKITKADAGCGTGKQTRAIPMSDKFWEPSPVKAWFEVCEDDIEATFWVWGTKNGIDRYDLIANQDAYWEQYILEVLQEALEDDLLRMIFFMDVDADDITGGGVLTDGIDITDYTMNDGFWKQAFAIRAGVPDVAITENGNATYALQDGLASDRGYQVLRGLYNNADRRLKDQSDLVYLVTGSLFDNRIDEKEAKLLTTSFERQDQRFREDVYRSIPIIDMGSIWDRWIRADFDNATTWDIPHRAALVSRSNIVVGFDAESETNKWTSWYNIDTEKVNAKGAYKIDFHIMRDYLISLAY